MEYALDDAIATEAVLAGPWQRFWARSIDVTLYSFPAGLVAGVLFPSLFADEALMQPGGEYVIGVLILPLVMLIDAAVISFFSTSPGKAIAGISIGHTDGQNLSFEMSMKRNLQVYVRGLVFGIPFLVMFGYISGYKAVGNNGVTSWDLDTDSRAFSSSDNPARTIAAGILALGLTAFSLAAG